MANNRGEIKVVESPEALAQEAVRVFTSLAKEFVESDGYFSVALSGGSTPEAMFKLLSQSDFREQIDWSKAHIFWSDERFVAPDDPDSNFLVARQLLLDHVPIPEQNVHAVKTVGLTPEESAEAYEEELVAVHGSSSPRLHLVLLGMGPDAHTASLFPGHPEVLQPSDKLVVPVYNSPKPPPTRISFTFKAINDAANVIILAAGAGKANVLQVVLNQGLDVANLPIQGIQPKNGSLTWLLDRAAAQQVA